MEDALVQAQNKNIFHKKQEVLILVLMEDALVRPQENFSLMSLARVLILVLMEDALVLLDLVVSSGTVTKS